MSDEPNLFWKSTSRALIGVLRALAIAILTGSATGIVLWIAGTQQLFAAAAGVLVALAAYAALLSIFLAKKLLSHHDRD